MPVASVAQLSGNYLMVHAAWNIAIRDAFNIPRASHRYFIEEVSVHLHPMVMLSSRFLKFHETLQKSEKFNIRYLSELSSSNLRSLSKLSTIITNMSPALVQSYVLLAYGLLLFCLALFIWRKKHRRLHALQNHNPCRTYLRARLETDKLLDSKAFPSSSQSIFEELTPEMRYVKHFGLF
jgi:hypothetical protein